MTFISPCGPRSRPTAPCDGEVSPASSGACSSLHFGFVAAFVGMDITLEQSLTRFPDISAARTVENSLNLVVLLLWVIHSLALYRTLRRTSPTPAPDYGKRIGRTTVALGAAGLAAAAAFLVGVPAMGAVGMFALIGFHLTLVWKTHRLARAPHSRMFAGV